MNFRSSRLTSIRFGAALAAALAVWHVGAGAQDRLKLMPGYDQFEKMTRATQGLADAFGSLAVTWTEDSSALDFARGGKLYRFDVASRKASVVGEAPEGRGETPARGRTGRSRSGQRGRGNGRQPARGRQFESADSPDKKLKAFYKDRNVWLSAADGSNERAVTKEGSEKDRIKIGTASWV